MMDDCGPLSWDSPVEMNEFDKECLEELQKELPRLSVEEKDHIEKIVGKSKKVKDMFGEFEKELPNYLVVLLNPDSSLQHDICANILKEFCHLKSFILSRLVHPTLEMLPELMCYVDVAKACSTATTRFVRGATAILNPSGGQMKFDGISTNPIAHITRRSLRSGFQLPLSLPSVKEKVSKKRSYPRQSLNFKRRAMNVSRK